VPFVGSVLAGIPGADAMKPGLGVAVTRCTYPPVSLTVKTVTPVLFVITLIEGTWRESPLPTHPLVQPRLVVRPVTGSVTGKVGSSELKTSSGVPSAATVQIEVPVPAGPLSWVAKVTCHPFVRLTGYNGIEYGKGLGMVVDMSIRPNP